MMAANVGHAPVVKLLVEAGADKEAKTRNSKRTALDFAKQNGHAECVMILEA